MCRLMCESHQGFYMCICSQVPLKCPTAKSHAQSVTRSSCILMYKSDKGFSQRSLCLLLGYSEADCGLRTRLIGPHHWRTSQCCLSCSSNSCSRRSCCSYLWSTDRMAEEAQSYHTNQHGPMKHNKSMKQTWVPWIVW